MVMLFLVLNGLMNVIYSQIVRDIEIRSKYFGYINYKRTYITLPDTILKLPLKDIDTAKTFIQGMFFDRKQNLKKISDSLWYGELFSPTEVEWVGKQEIPENFVNLLCDNGMVNIARDYRTDYWFQIFHIKEDTIIQHFKEQNEFWFLGKITINPNFDSYLFLTKERDTYDEHFFFRSLFLLNVKNSIITSLLQIAFIEICGGEGPYFFTKASSRGKYCYYGVSYSEVLIRNWLGKIKEPQKGKYTYYSFDNDGYVQIHELKGRKKFIIYKQKYKVLIHENIR